MLRLCGPFSDGVFGEASSPHKLTTANDRIDLSEEASVRVPELALESDALVMDKTPSVLSSGRHCMRMGGFV